MESQATRTYSLPDPLAPHEFMHAGAIVGRFHILYPIGSGGMGSVYAAYDPELDRKVAIKLVHGVDRKSSRFEREAQAMARLNHPNVVGIYDVGEFEDQTFIAMEFVDGATLRDWLLMDEQRPWQEIVERFIEAGRGLAEAHRAGVVHQDFKLANVLIDRDGRVLVSDFGVAADFRAEVDERAGAHSGGSSVAGTPNYIAPERFQGAAPDPRSDQFSFCVALYRALKGEAPFLSTSGLPFAEVVEQVEIFPPSVDQGDLPDWLCQAIKRGLSGDPAQRFETMDDLLEALNPRSHSRSARVWRWSLIVAFLSATSLVSIALFQNRPEICPTPSERSADFWNLEKKENIRSAFLSLSTERGERFFEPVAARVDSYLSSWQTMHQDVCRATHLRGEQSEALLDARMFCLDSKLEELRATLEVLSGPQIPPLPDATSLVLGLSDIEQCADRVVLSALQPPPKDPEKRAEIDALLREHQELSIEVELGRPIDMDRVQEMVDQATELEFHPLESRVLYLQGLVYKINDPKPKLAMEILEKSLSAAIAANDYPRQMRLYGQLLETASLALGDLELAAKWAPYARAALASLKPAYEESRGALEVNLGIYAWREGRIEEAFARLASAVEIHERIWGSDSVHFARTLQDFAIVAADIEGQIPAAIETLGRALQIRESFHGPDHPQLIPLLGNLAGILAMDGRYAEALEAVHRGIAIAQEAENTNPFDAAVLRINEASLELASDRPRPSVEPLSRAAEILLDLVGKDHILFAHVEDMSGERWLLEGDAEQAFDLFAKAHARRMRIYANQDHPEIRVSWLYEARALLDLGETDAALPRLEKTAAIREGRQPRDQILLDLSLGRAYLEKSQLDLAMKHLNLAASSPLAAREPALLSETRFALARLNQQRGEGATAELAKSALEGLSSANSPRTRHLRSEIENWIKHLPSPSMAASGT